MAPPPEDEEAAIDAILEAGVDDDEEEDPEEVEPWIPSSDSEPDEDRPALEPPDPSPAAAEAALQPARMAVKEEKGEGEEARPRWPGWPGASVFRLLVPADKVGGLIGRCGSTIKRLCDETRARVRVIDAAHAAADRIVRLRFLSPQNLVRCRAMFLWAVGTCQWCRSCCVLVRMLCEASKRSVVRSACSIVSYGIGSLSLWESCLLIVNTRNISHTFV